MNTTRLTLAVEFDSKRTDAESIATALDRLTETALSTPGIVDDCGPIEVGAFEPSPDPSVAGEFWVMLYHHRHGDDFSLYRSQAAAAQAVVDIIREWVGDIEGHDSHPRIVQLLELPDVHLTERYRELLRLWEDATDESFEIDRRSVE